MLSFSVRRVIDGQLGLKMVSHVDKTWERKRKYTLIAYVVQYTIIGFEKSVTGITLWMYLTTMIKTGNPELFFGIIGLVYFAPSLFFSMLVARLVDRSRRTKLIISICNFMSMVGCVIYVIPRSPYYPMIGQILMGLNFSITRIITSAEIARSYPTDEMEKKLPILMVFFFVGYSVGPIVGNLLRNVNFTLFGLPITICNISGLLSLILFMSAQISILTLAHDLSKEYDLKEMTSENKHKPANDEEETSWNVLKKVVKKFDVLFVMIMTILAAFSRLAFDHSFPVIVGKLSLPYYLIEIFYISQSVILVGIIVVLTASKHTRKAVYLSGVASILFLLISGTFQTILIKVELNIASDIILTFLLSTCITVVEIGEQFFLLTVSANLISSKHQGYVESIRDVLRAIGSILGSLVSAYVVEYCFTFLIGLALSCFIQLVVLIVRRKTYKDPKILI